jgi:hypothetical protein
VRRDSAQRIFAQTMQAVESVFGATRRMPASYVPRPRLDDAVSRALLTDGHIVIWGESRQGKSGLLQRALTPDDYCTIQCAYGHKRYHVYRMLLREIGASVTVEKKRKRARGIGARVSFFSGQLSTDSEVSEHSIDIDIGTRLSQDHRAGGFSLSLAHLSTQHHP